jgi:hypothetical protein
MFNKSLFTSLIASLVGLGASLSLDGATKHYFKTPKKPSKQLPSMVIDYADMAEWNRKVAAGKISRKGHRHA